MINFVSVVVSSPFVTGCIPSNTPYSARITFIDLNEEYGSSSSNQRLKRRAALINECLQRLSDTRKRLQSSSEFHLNIVAVELIYENENDNPDVQFDSQDEIKK